MVEGFRKRAPHPAPGNTGSFGPKKAKFDRRSITNHGFLLHLYLSTKLHGARWPTAQSTPNQPKSLFELSIARLASDPSIIQNAEAMPDLDYPDDFLALAREYLFSEKLSWDDWQSQLTILGLHNAKIAGHDANNFQTVRLINLAEMDGNTISSDKQQLTIVYGHTVMDQPLLLKKCCVVGAKAPVVFADSSMSFNLPEATVELSSNAELAAKNQWEIESTDATKLNAGVPPVVYALGASVCGMRIKCRGEKEQGIVATYGHVHISYNEILNTGPHGIFIHDCLEAAVTYNYIQCSTKNRATGVVSANIGRYLHYGNENTNSHWYRPDR